MDEEYMAALRGTPFQSTGRTYGAGSYGQGPVVNPTGANLRQGGCYKCGNIGHWASDCQMTGSVAAPTGFSEKLCPCGAGPCPVLTANTDKNRGRQFYRCPKRKDDGQCEFFEWLDAPHDQLQMPMEPDMNCPCGGGRCAVRTAKTEHNNGRRFYSCPLPQRCGFFKWCDDAGNNENRSTAVTTSGGGGGGGGRGSGGAPCFKCGQVGHWARDCNAGGGGGGGGGGGAYGNSSPVGGNRMHVSSNNNNSRGNCYKCGQSGHWANSCPA